MNPREFVETLDLLICCRIDIHREMQLAVPDQKYVAQQYEQCEVLMRQLTDYLLAADSRKGLYAKGEHE